MKRLVARSSWAVLPLFGSIFAGILLSPARADEPPPPEIRVARLIRLLGSDSYAERKQADDELKTLGVESRREVELAARSADPEVRARASELLRQLKLKDLWAAGQIKLDVQKEPAARVVRTLMEQTGNHIMRGDSYGQFQDAEVRLQYPRGSFWEVVDDLCRQSGNHLRPHFDAREPGLVLVQGPPGKSPLAYAGPLRAQITSARRVFIEELDYDEKKSDLTHTFQINVQVMWEDRFQLVAFRAQPDVTAAVTDTKANLAPLPSGNVGWSVAGNGTRQLTAGLRLTPPPANVKQLSKLTLNWGLVAVGDLAAIDVNDLSSKQTHSQDDVQLKVEEVEERPGGRYDVSVLISRKLSVPDPQEILFQENLVELFDENGKAFRAQGQSNGLSDQGARMKITFAGDSSYTKPKSLRLTYPRLRSQRNVEIVFRDVPLPVQRPE